MIWLVCACAFLLLPALLLALYAVGIQYQRGGLWWLVSPIAIVAIPLDVLLNYTVLAAVTWDFPRAGEYTFSNRLNRLVKLDNRLGDDARWIAGILNDLAPGHDHIKGFV